MRVCFYCGKEITGYFCSDHGKHFHPDCFPKYIREKRSEQEVINELKRQGRWAQTKRD